ncbi:hypothetical protein EV426DRAFT_351371 [Tirmania nivea]|nr:hypothetical protein EV426DRAFT_351371 [Tirmania nivea]
MATVFDTLLSGGSSQPPPAIPPSACTSLENPSWPNLLFSLLILVGILGSYIPQHHRIISRQSSEGISPFFLLLGCTSGTGTFLNILILSRNVLGCCRYIGGFNCFAAGLGVAQVGTQWICFVVIILLFMIYVPRDTKSLAPPPPPPSQSWKNPFSNTHPTASTALIVTLACIVHFVVHIILAFYIAAIRPSSLVSYASFLGVQATILASVQYIPQIFTTWKLGHVGSLSIPMMCIQTPGSFVWAVSLAMREGTAWSSWITYVVTGILQGCLLVMCVMFEIRDRRSKAKGVGAVVNGAASRYGAINSSRREQGGYGSGDGGEERPLLEGNR